MLWSIPHYKKIRKEAIWYVTDIYSNLLLGYLADFLLKVKNTVECILDLIQKRKNSLGYGKY